MHIAMLSSDYVTELIFVGLRGTLYFVVAMKESDDFCDTIFYLFHTTN